jgi:hypothetical protein
MVFFGEINVFLQLSLIVLFGENRAYILLENCDLQEVFIEKNI